MLRVGDAWDGGAAVLQALRGERLGRLWTVAVLGAAAVALLAALGIAVLLAVLGAEILLALAVAVPAARSAPTVRVGGGGIAA